MRPRLVAEWRGGMTPAVQQKLDVAAAHLRCSRNALEAAREEAEEGSDAELRCEEALQDLEGALFHAEWAEPRD